MEFSFIVFETAIFEVEFKNASILNGGTENVKIWIFRQELL